MAIGRAKLNGSAKLAFSVANSEIRWAELVPSRTVLTLSIQNGPACSKSALEKLGPIWPLGSIWLFSFYSVQSLLRRHFAGTCDGVAKCRLLSQANKGASLKRNPGPVYIFKFDFAMFML